MTQVLKCGVYDVDKLSFELPDSFKKRQIQDVMLPIYDGNRSPFIQLPPVELNAYGVPSRADWFKDDQQRAFIKLPVTGELREFMEKMDKKFGSDEMKEVLFGNRCGKFQYQPIVRTTEAEGKPPYIKLNLHLDFISHEIQTAIAIEKDGVKETVMGIRTVDDVAKHVPFKSTVTCIIQPAKLWMQPASTSNPKYGVTFKIFKILVKIPQRLPNEINIDFVD